MFISEALAQTTTASTPNNAFSGLMQYLPFVLIFVFMYLFVMRPQMKKQKQQQNMLKNLAKGDEVITIGGILGRITQVNDSYIIVNIANNTDIKCQKNAISHVLPKGTIKDIE